MGDFHSGNAVGCTHDLFEREAACVDGYCLICSQHAVRRLNDRLEATQEALAALVAKIDALAPDIDGVFQMATIPLAGLLKRIGLPKWMLRVPPSAGRRSRAWLT